MPKIIAISGEIGWDVWPDDIRQQIEDAAGEDIIFEISSPGGYIYDGLEIFNLIRNYQGHTTTYAVGMAASMASYLLMAGDKKKAASNAIFMIHNARAWTGGDQNAHRKLANILEGMSNMLGQEYIKQSGKSKEEITTLMNDETYLFGKEILEGGFVDELVDIEGDAQARDDVVLEAMFKVDSLIEKLKNKPEGIEKIAACLNNKQDSEPVKNSDNQRSSAKQESKKEENMDLKEFLAQNPQAKAEYEAQLKAEFDKGADSVTAKIEAVKPFLESENYKEVHAECIQVITGKEEVGTVKAMVKAIDKVKALHESETAKTETEKQGETFQGKSEKSTDGIVRNAEDEAEAIAKLRGK